jgi:hypothetical protein
MASNFQRENVSVNFRFTERATATIPADAKGYDFTVPGNSEMPIPGDLLTVAMGHEQVTFKVLQRRFEFVPKMTTLELILGAVDEPLP